MSVRKSSSLLKAILAVQLQYLNGKSTALHAYAIIPIFFINKNKQKKISHSYNH
jgi:hypothetical protein